MEREELSELIFKNLHNNKAILKKQFVANGKKNGFFYLDNLLPKEVALEIYNKFPTEKETVQKKNLRERKHIAYQMDKYDSLLEEVIYAFQCKKKCRFNCQYLWSS